MTRNARRGRRLRDLLQDEGVLAEVHERAMKQALVLPLAQGLKDNDRTRAERPTHDRTPHQDRATLPSA